MHKLNKLVQTDLYCFHCANCIKTLCYDDINITQTTSKRYDAHIQPYYHVKYAKSNTLYEIDNFVFKNAISIVHNVEVTLISQIMIASISKSCYIIGEANNASRDNNIFKQVRRFLKMSKKGFGKCQVAGCSNIGIYAVALAKRGDRNAYICEFHKNNNEWYHSGGRNEAGASDKFRTVSKKCGIELETSFTSESARIELCGNGFTPTDDCSLYGDFTTEYVSPLYYGMNSIVRYVKSIDKMLKSGDIEINETCGTHFHFSINNMVTESGLNICRLFSENPQYFNRTFAPVSLRMTRDSEKTERVFGRGFGEYCMPIKGQSDPDNRYYWINVTNRNNVEFRLFKFTSAAQYTACMKFAEKVVTSIMNNFDKFGQMTESEKLHKCDVVANKIVKTFEAM